ncbi:hypothetical protein MVEN_00451700 [Mycena venus]|uniref:Uncharacterized protein n=1 Tax=Mycena venus TaxID=2733690 RepID=A0A8H6YV30_9AGAR|nr:hypothetical protein MVEN_00451700 [Mycena venus]
MPHQNTTAIPLVVERARYLPPRNPLDSEMGIVDATTLILLQKMMADSYEHGRVVWKENRARRAITVEGESDDLPCGPNSAQKKVEAWLIDAGLLAPDVADVSDETESGDESMPLESLVPPEPDTPRRRPWHRRLKILIPRKTTPTSVSEPSLQSPRSPLSPTNLWSAVQRGTSSIATIRLKPKHILQTPSSPSVARSLRKKCYSLDSGPAGGPSSTPRQQSGDFGDTLLATAFKRAAMLRTITDDDVEAIMRRHRDPLPPRPTPRTEPFTSSELFHVTPKAKPKAKPRPQFEDPASYRWPALPPPIPPVLEHELERVQTPTPCPDVRWYHFAFLLFAWHFLIISLSTYFILRLIFRPLMCLTVIYCAVLLVQMLLSLF